MIAKVVIDIDHYKLNKTYDYKIPASLIENLKVGMRIFVPFQKKVRSGIVINIDNFSKQKNIKNILEIDIMKPLLNKNDLERIDFMRKSYAMNYYEAIKLYMPNIFKIKYKTKIIKIKDNELTEKFKEFFNKDKIWVLKQNQKEFLPRLNYIQQKGYIKIKEEIVKNSKLIKYNEDFKIDTNNHEEADKNKIGFEIVGSLYSNIDLIKQKIENNIKKNQSTLIIVPEKNMIKKISVMLNLEYIQYHSKLSESKKSETEILVNNKTSLIIGTKSSIMLKIKYLRSIFVFYCGHNSYDYIGGHDFNIYEVIENFYSTKERYYHSIAPSLKNLNMLKFKNNYEKPNVKFISMRKELIEGNRNILSRELLKNIHEALNNNKKVILFYPKKGFMSFNMCRMCGEVSKCSDCSMTLKVLKNKKLYCDKCKIEYLNPRRCSNGHQGYLKPVGLGLEYVKEKIEEMFIEKNVVLIDKDTNKKNIEYDILIGTQVVNQFLDDDIGLVAIILSDILWNQKGYDTNEIAYQTILSMTNLFSKRKYRTYIQTYQIDHDVIKAINNPNEFIKNEKFKRKLALNPPYSKLYEIYISTKHYLQGYRKALSIIDYFRNNNITIIGPTSDKSDDFFILSVKLEHKHSKIFYEWMFMNDFYIKRV